MTPTEFLTTLWGEKPEGWVLLWTAQNKRSNWFMDFRAVNRFVDTYKKEMDIYTGVSIARNQPSILRNNHRITSANSAGIPGLWADIDVQGPEHARPNLPKNQEKAMEALASFEYQPSIIINSGHGLQCWWLFDRPWIFKDEHERRLAQQLAWEWHDLLAAEWASRGWHLDSTYDLARVLRLPGTMNHKGIPVKVEVVQTSDFRWRELPELKAPLLLDEAGIYVPNLHSFRNMPDTLIQKNPTVPLELNPELELSPYRQSQLVLAKEAIRQFADTMERNRQFKNLDESASAYDMSIAHWCASIGFSDQDIAIAIIQWRKRHGFDLEKVMRQDYMQRTIGKARSSVNA